LWTRLAEAEAFESEGQVADAIQNYEGVLALDPRRANIHYRMGRTYLTHWKSIYSAADLTSAASEFEKELEVYPGNANAAYELAELRVKQGEKASRPGV
jgi:tetratricopeptide (TPR) repeat protein